MSAIMEGRKYFIEFRIYLREDAKVIEVKQNADVLQDKLANLVSDPAATPIFTQDVTYEVKMEKTHEA